MIAAAETCVDPMMLRSQGQDRTGIQGSAWVLEGQLLQTDIKSEYLGKHKYVCTPLQKRTGSWEGQQSDVFLQLPSNDCAHAVSQTAD